MIKNIFLFLSSIIVLISFGEKSLAADWEENEDDQSKLRRNVEKTYEKSIYAKIQVSNGMIYINKAPKSKVFAGEFFFNQYPPFVAYEIIGDQGRLSVKMTEKSRKSKRKEADDESGEVGYDIRFDNLYSNECYLNFSDNIPISLIMDFGMIKGNLDLGGLQIDQCKIDAAVSQATIDFSHSNPILLEELKIESGVGKLKMLNICNANFKNFDFEAGAGSYILKFNGNLRQDATADIEIGMGNLEIYLPRNIGVRIEYDKSFLSSFNINNVYKEDDYYYNKLWDKSGPQLDIQLQSGMVRVSVEWID